MSVAPQSREDVDYTLLLSWLQAATKGLSEEARARIREEITDHFHQALDRGIDDGLEQEAAARKAVDDLGSPEAARHAFRRTYLSRWQGYLLKRLIEPPDFRSPRTSVILPHTLTPNWDPMRARQFRPFVATLLAVMSALFVAIFYPTSWMSYGFAAVMAATAGVFKFVLPPLARHGQQKTAVALGAIAEIALWSAYLVAPVVYHPRLADFRIGTAAVVATLFAIAYAPLVYKLSNQPRRGSGTDHPGLEPPR